MRLDITGRHMEITAPVRQLITKRVSRLERLLNDAAVSALITLSKEKYRLHTEIVVHTKGDHVLRGAGEGNAWTISIRQASEKIEQQAQTLKGKWDGRKRTAAPRVVRPGPAEVSPVPRIVKNTRYAVKPMSLEDAALRVDGDADAFVVFRNADTDAVSILYRRRDGNLGLIEPE
jgi:ribosome hibernation promoting factor